jgi:hypothetical protein
MLMNGVIAMKMLIALFFTGIRFATIQDAFRYFEAADRMRTPYRWSKDAISGVNSQCDQVSKALDPVNSLLCLWTELITRNL